jgi:type I restriction enzyme M protein
MQAKSLVKEPREGDTEAKEIVNAVYDLKADNPHKKLVVDTRTPEALLGFIEAKGREFSGTRTALRRS